MSKNKSMINYQSDLDFKIINKSDSNMVKSKSVQPIFTYNGGHQ